MNQRSDDSHAAQAAALAGVLREALGKLVRRLREQASFGDLTWSQISVLRRLEREGPATVTTLARAEGMRPQSMGANVAVLEAAGWVSGAPDPTDGRRTILSLTPACRKWVKAGRAAREDWLSKAMQSKLTAGEMKKLAAAAELLQRLAES